MSGPDRLVKGSECYLLVGLSRTTVAKLEREDKFPRRVVVSGNRVRWRMSELQAWIESRVSKPKTFVREVLSEERAATH